MKAILSVLLVLVLVSIPLPALADFVNQDIEDTDLMTGDWVKQYGDANVNAGWARRTVEGHADADERLDQDRGR
jgi:hypothetical protein